MNAEDEGALFRALGEYGVKTADNKLCGIKRHLCVKSDHSKLDRLVERISVCGPSSKGRGIAYDFYVLHSVLTVIGKNSKKNCRQENYV